jgi:hypothetical protein
MKDREDDFYTDETEVDSSSESSSEGSEREEDNTPTTIVPKDVFAGKNPEVGDKVKMRIVAVHDDSYEVQCEHDYEGEDKEESETETVVETEAEVPAGMME